MVLFSLLFSQSFDIKCLANIKFVLQAVLPWGMFPETPRCIIWWLLILMFVAVVLMDVGPGTLDKLTWCKNSVRLAPTIAPFWSLCFVKGRIQSSVCQKRLKYLSYPLWTMLGLQNCPYHRILCDGLWLFLLQKFTVLSPSPSLLSSYQCASYPFPRKRWFFCVWLFMSQGVGKSNSVSFPCSCPSACDGKGECRTHPSF